MADLTRGETVIILIGMSDWNFDKKLRRKRTMENFSAINIVGSDCSPGKEDEFNEWYPHHVSLVLESPLTTGAERYVRLSNPSFTKGNEDSYPKYLAIYHFIDEKALREYITSPILERNRQDVRNRWPNYPSEGFISKWRVTYKRIATWVK
ncbi:MAG: hypothetical protein HYX79_10350 [Chloroflexi bacterium]|nr:hypothetical protein [Chloroflexota bacterium]